jgi:hypothetical protein
MRKLLALAVLSVLLGGATGCRIGECWREAWCSRLCPQRQQAVIVSEPCVVTDSCCNPCCSPCTEAPAMTPIARP